MVLELFHHEECDEYSQMGQATVGPLIPGDNTGGMTCRDIEGRRRAGQPSS
jgi:hypothetical protein